MSTIREARARLDAAEATLARAEAALRASKRDADIRWWSECFGRAVTARDRARGELLDASAAALARKAAKDAEAER